MERGGNTQKTATSKKIAAESQQHEEKRKERENCSWAWPLERHGAVLWGLNVGVGVFHDFSLINFGGNKLVQGRTLISQQVD